jgi:hypothetical protein
MSRFMHALHSRKQLFGCIRTFSPARVIILIPCTRHPHSYHPELRQRDSQHRFHANCLARSSSHQQSAISNQLAISYQQSAISNQLGFYQQSAIRNHYQQSVPACPIACEMPCAVPIAWRCTAQPFLREVLCYY